jgi:hypothetical protein
LFQITLASLQQRFLETIVPLILGPAARRFIVTRNECHALLSGEFVQSSTLPEIDRYGAIGCLPTYALARPRISEADAASALRFATPA